ncbi:MAG: hypothetical protein K1X72_04345 [Pyrinomonadaceae bacterium]|nr:hypothetical protein [Pyrinomonadaceae bacterium]
MGEILKHLPVSVLIQFLPFLFIKVGNYFKGKDANSTGTDDVVGDIFIAAAPAVEAATSNTTNETALRKSLKIVRDIIDGYLAQGDSK